MAKTAIQQLKQWFVTAAKPLQTHYWAWLESFWHKDEKLPISSVQGLSELLNQQTYKRITGVVTSGNFFVLFPANSMVTVVTILSTAGTTIHVGKSGEDLNEYDVLPGQPLDLTVNRTFLAGESLQIDTEEEVNYSIYTFNA